MSSSDDMGVRELSGLGGLLEQHRDRLLQMVRRRIDPALAVRVDPEEIVQEAFLVACRKWAGYRAERRRVPTLPQSDTLGLCADSARGGF